MFKCLPLVFGVTQVHVTSHSASYPLPRGPAVLDGYFTDVAASEVTALVRPPALDAGVGGAALGAAATHLVRVRAANKNGWGAFSPFYPL